ncbi:BsuPI-related putative proteinase inhibitor [Shewanella sp. AS1]|uniref:BsuPI-related putative proteinase inhibitor n=1 Tax=Shewanella sp. AS1 TaxID=2907626 RepID=UPI001F1F966C|nr:BsuPI-related putative proteinase inhibitor [Shewanella sp. AS1]MCE9678815.1 BsuPI-related putative proteinase inhibitor [Shewanella sp. AS1]
MTPWIVKVGLITAIMLMQACSNEAQSDLSSESASVPVTSQQSAPGMGTGPSDLHGETGLHVETGLHAESGLQKRQTENTQGYQPMLVGQTQYGQDKKRESAMNKAEGILNGVLTSQSDVKGLAVTLTITNPRSVGVAIQYRSGMTADLWLVDPNGKRLWAWSSEMMFTQALRDVVIGANKSVTVKFLVPAKVLAKAPRGSMLVAKYAGRVQDSSMQAMADVELPLMM